VSADVLDQPQTRATATASKVEHRARAALGQDPCDLVEAVDGDE
jgi:hypothetical protein